MGGVFKVAEVLHKWAIPISDQSNQNGGPEQGDQNSTQIDTETRPATQFGTQTIKDYTTFNQIKSDFNFANFKHQLEREVEHMVGLRVGENFSPVQIAPFLEKFYHNDVARYVAHWEETNKAKV